MIANSIEIYRLYVSGSKRPHPTCLTDDDSASRSQVGGVSVQMVNRVKWRESLVMCENIPFVNEYEGVGRATVRYCWRIVLS